VVLVTWHDAVDYCRWLTSRLRQNFSLIRDKGWRIRLPSEAEWEKAARGGDSRIYPWGNRPDSRRANYHDTKIGAPSPVGSFPAGASPCGCLDMTGNVWEWTADWYQAYPGNTTGDAYYGETCRVTRGGGWFDSEPQATTFNRNCAAPNKTAIDELGFRCVRL
jgi:formylglycine-generating enzyme required for sulfatase activity